MEFSDLTIKEASELLSTKKISAKELAKMAIGRIGEVDSKVHAFLTVTEEQALKSAEEADGLIAEGENSILTGIPYGVKDCILVKGVKATAASKILENYIAPYDATVIKKYNQAGAVMVGKTNMDEFAMGASTLYSAYGPTYNPYDLTRVPGGSSGGSAAAVAAGEVLFTLGSDTFGSIRQPASFCGVVGLKPTYGRVSRYGLMAMCSSMDQIGVLAKTVEDSVLAFQLIAGQDELDSTSLPKPVPDYSTFLKEDLKGLRVGIPKEFFIDGMDPEVKQIVEDTIKKLESLGAIVSEASIPHAPYAVPAYYIIAPVEISANISRYDGIRFGLSALGKDLNEVYFNSRSVGLGAEVKRRIMIGTYASSAGYLDAYYKKAKQVQSLITKDFVDAFKKFDLLLTPVSPKAAFKVDEPKDPVSMYLEDVFTGPLNLAGVPGISIPAGLTKSGLPVGVQLIANYFAEEQLFAAGLALEKALSLKLKPKL